MEIIGTTSSEKRPERRCPTCGDPPYISFNWKYAHEKGDEEMRLMADAIKEVRPMKFGFLHQCLSCSQYWVLDDRKYEIERVPKDREAILFQWDSVNLPLGSDQLRVLEEIGGTGADHYGNGRERIEIPCAVERQDGVLFDPAILWVTKKPPIVGYLPHVALWQNVKTVLPTDYALPFEVREHALHADEVSMGFAPTLVSANNEEILVLNWSPSLIFHGGIKGKDLRLSESHVRFGKSVPFAQSPDIGTVHFFADWFPGAEKLNKAR